MVGLICCSTYLDGMFLTFKRIVSDVGKSHITFESVKLLAFNAHSDTEGFVGQSKREKAAGVPLTPCSFISVFNKQH